MADLDLNELERLEKAATPGPWEGPWGDTHTVAAFEGELNEYSLTNDPRGDAFPVMQETKPNDAALIAAMRNALPELLRRLRAAESDNANLLRQLLRVVGDHSAPKDCYSTGPLTGTALDHSCPSCEALSMLAARKP